MGLASLVLGVGSVVLAALTAAPCFGWLVFFGLPLALSGLITGLWQLAQSGQRKLRGAEGAPEGMVRYALTGVGLSFASAVWMGFMLLLKGFAL